MFKHLLNLLLVLFVFNSVQAQSFYNTEISSTVSSNNNIYKDSTKASDQISSLKATVNLYPLSIVKVNLLSEYTNYGRNPNLTNINYGGGITLLPISNYSKFSLLLNLNYNKYEHKFINIEDIENLDWLNNSLSSSTDNVITSIFSLSYQYHERAIIRIGFNNTKTEYTLNETPEKNSYDIFTGLNFSMFGSNAFDFEIGHSFEKYYNLPEYMTLYLTPLDSIKLNYAISSYEAYDILQESDLNSIYLSLRYSRPLGKKTGLSLNYSYRQFTESEDNTLIYGKSTQYHSPWLNMYEGSSIQLKLKSYMIPRLVLNFGLGYWDRSYLRTVEKENNLTNTSNSFEHADEFYRMFLSFSLPIVTTSGRLFEPTINLDYSDNNSNIDLYKYDNFRATISLNIK